MIYYRYLWKCYGNTMEILRLCYGCATALQPTVTTVNYTDYRFRGNVTWFADVVVLNKKRKKMKKPTYGFKRVV
jgi:hypothetical protein